MTEEDRRRLGEDRRLIFENVANGVPLEHVAAAFRRSVPEVERELGFVAKKLREYRFRRRQPPLDCDQVKDIRWNRVPLLETLRKLGPDYLSSELILPRIGVHRVETPAHLTEAAHQVGARVTKS